ncbi:MAG: regulatory protein RecX [Lutibacter sp.]|nr:regulatory protein RecX [Lutibacter sp.]
MKNDKTYTVAEATKLMENFCAYQERCHKEVAQKLCDLRMIPEAKDKITLHLLQHNFLNEERFSKAFARGKFSMKNWGKVRIVNELKFRNISPYNIKTALKEIDDEDYLKTIQKVAKKKYAVIKEPNSFKKRSKLLTYLSSKGYESELIYDIVKDLI